MVVTDLIAPSAWSRKQTATITRGLPLLRTVGLVRGTLAPGEINNTGGFYDGNFTDLITAMDGDLGQFYTCLRLYEDFDDEHSQNNVILVNTFGQDTTGGTFEMATASQNLPFMYEMAEDETLHFFDSIARPERILDAALTEDPEYFWLDPQEGVEDVVCGDFRHHWVLKRPKF